MLTLVTQPGSYDRLGEARQVIHLVEMGRPFLWPAVTAVLLMLGLAMVAVGAYPMAGLLLGAATSLALCRYGPSWWPGRR